MQSPAEFAWLLLFILFYHNVVPKRHIRLLSSAYSSETLPFIWQVCRRPVLIYFNYIAVEFMPHCVLPLLSIRSSTTWQSSGRFFNLENFYINVYTCNRSTLLLLFLRVSFSFLHFPGFSSIFRLLRSLGVIYSDSFKLIICLHGRLKFS